MMVDFITPPRLSIGVILWFHQETIINPSILYESRCSLKNSQQNHLFSSPKTPGMPHIQVRFVLTLVEIVSSSFSGAEKTRPF